MPNDKKEPQAFTSNEYYALSQAIEKLGQSQLGALTDRMSASELEVLFIPETHRKHLRHVYEIEEPQNQRGELFVDLISLLPKQRNIYDTNAHAVVVNATMRFYFNITNEPHAFITPKTICGTKDAPIKAFVYDAPEAVKEKFRDQAQLLLDASAEWTLVNWVLGILQKSCRSPAQVRYVWPAIHTLTSVAKLKMNLAEPSARAGANAKPDPQCFPYLKGTYDTVARSAYIGVNDEFIARYKAAHCQVIKLNIEMKPGNSHIGFHLVAL